MAALSPKSVIDALDKRWERQLHDVVLLGEIVLDASTWRQLAAALHDLTQHLGPSGVVEWLERMAVHATAVFLVQTGIRRYAAGDYWTGVSSVLEGADVNHLQRLGKRFEELLRRRGKPTFAGMEGRRYLKAILGHGGIPRYCRRDFFAVLHQAAFGRRWAGLPAQDLVSEWRASPGSVFAGSDVPIRRFLLGGGRVAAEFLDRCLEMAVRTGAEGEVPPASEVRLPSDLVDDYREWSSEVTPASMVHALPSGPHLHATLEFDPQDGVVFRLPDRAERHGPAVRTEWHLSEGTSSRTVVLPGVGDAGWHRVRAMRPCQLYEARDRSGAIRRFPGFDSELRLLAFSQDGRRILDVRRGAAREPVWLLHPTGHDVGIETASGAQSAIPVLLKAGPMLGGWRGIAASLVDLSDARAITTRDVRLEIEGARPCRLIADEALPNVATEDGWAVYPTMPRLEVPLDATAPELAATELRRWQVRLRTASAHDWGSWIEVDLGDALQRPTPRGMVARVALKPSGAEAGTNVGAYDVSVRGPLGRQFRAAFGVAEGMRWFVSARSEVLEVETSDHTSLTIVPNELEPLRMTVRAVPGGRLHRIQSDGSRRFVTVQLRAPCSSELTVRMRLPGLRWRLLRDASDGEWRTTEETASREALLAGSSPSLAIEHVADTPYGEAALAVVREPEGAVIQEGPKTQLRRDGRAAVTRLDIDPFLDTLRRADGAGLTLSLRLWREPGDGSQVVTRTVVRLRERWLATPTSARIGATTAERKIASLDLRWTEESRLAGRRIRVWRTGRPWEPPSVGVIPATASGQAIVPLDPPVAPLPLRVELFLEDPWATGSLPPFPERGADGTAEFDPREESGLAFGDDSAAVDPSGLVERALVAQQSGAGGRAAVEAVRALPTEDALQLALAVAAHVSKAALPPDSRLRADWIEPVLRQDTFRTLRALTAAYGSAEPRRRRRLVDAILTSGVLSALVRKDSGDEGTAVALTEDLWRLWRPFGFAVDARRLDCDPLARQRASSALGGSALSLLSHVRPGAMVQLRTGDVKTCSRLSNVEAPDTEASATFVPGLAVTGFVFEVAPEAGESRRLRFDAGRGTWCDEADAGEVHCELASQKCAFLEDARSSVGIHEVERSASQVRTMLHMLGPLESGAFHPTDAYPRVHADWLLRLAESPEAHAEPVGRLAAVADEERQWVQEAVSSGYLRKSVQEASDHRLDARRTLRPQIDVPYVSFVTSLAAVLGDASGQAGTPQQSGPPPLPRAVLAQATDLLLTLAPELFELDLLRWIGLLAWHGDCIFEPRPPTATVPMETP